MMKLLSVEGLRSIEDAAELKQVLSSHTKRALTKEINIWALLDILDQLSLNIADKYPDVAHFIAKKNLYQKLVRELGDDFERELRSRARERGLFEGYRPLGVLCHITPSNDPFVSFLASIEGLITGNINLIKLPSEANSVAIELYQELFRQDPDNIISDHLIVCAFASKERTLLETFLSFADGVSAWGGEQALQQIRSLLPIGTRFIPWGHRLSFAYLAQNLNPTTRELKSLALDVLKYRQQACSAPQNLFVEGDWARVQTIAKQLYQAMTELIDEQFLDQKDIRLSLQEQAEVTNYTLLKMTEEALGVSRVFGDPQSSCRVIAVGKSEMGASPLQNTLIVRPIERAELLDVLRPAKNFLQTTGLLANDSEMIELSDLLFAAGVTRVTPWGRMQESYIGEPHDGERALQRFLKRVRVESSKLENLTKWSEGQPRSLKDPDSRLPVTNKTQFAAMNQVTNEHRFVFKSGGSSGTQAISPFSYDDYHRQMRFAADGLLAAGLEPKRDRVMNLFFGGSLYGGFLSFTDILEKVDALQFPMSAVANLQEVAAAIVHFNVNTLMGMPSYLYLLFKENAELLREFKGIKKIFYGGEFIGHEMRDWYQREFGIELIKSASYGSVDAGPVAYQCAQLEGGAHHLHHGLHALEILALDSDRAVEGSEIGRLVYTTPSRLSTRVERYELGDIGRWITGDCSCTHRTPRFELVGRLGDIFRAGGNFFNYQKFEKTLASELGYNSPLQIEITKRAGLDHVEVLMEPVEGREHVVSLLLKQDRDLQTAVDVEKCVSLNVTFLAASEFKVSASSGKVLRVIEGRRQQ